MLRYMTVGAALYTHNKSLAGLVADAEQAVVHILCL